MTGTLLEPGDASVKKKKAKIPACPGRKNRKGLRVPGEVMAKIAAVLNRLVRRGLLEKMVFEKKLLREKRKSLRKCREKGIRGKAAGSANGLKTSVPGV